jgi:hypothetical protein
MGSPSRNGSLISQNGKLSLVSELHAADEDGKVTPGQGAMCTSVAGINSLDDIAAGARGFGPWELRKAQNGIGGLVASLGVVLTATAAALYGIQIDY